ncbi:MAG: glycosyltransferase family 2 protein [Cytophagaceae bacterium]|nr:glycosyltransferase family 2 protein [Cytophagaceae bacterium]MBK9933960.1 glycosyltransferase family 2 protein [Cytophagaceae bacterium]MBL0327349.1 glycosyltransferase family 2 protein [Cytophagaceae bacterium]
MATLFGRKSKKPTEKSLKIIYMNEMNEVSVLMPAFNAAKYISYSIDSVLNQTFQNFELLVYNDGSSDATLSILENYAKSDSRIRIIDSKINQGLTAGRNILYNAAKNNLIVWLDSDDIAYPNRIEKQILFLKNYPEFAGVSCWARVIDRENSPSGQFFKNYINNEHLKAVSLFVNYFVVSGMTMYKTVIPEPGFNPVFSPAEDYDMFVRIMQKNKLGILHEVLIDYRVHSNNLTATQSDKMQNAVLGIQKYQLERLGLNITHEQAKLHYDISFNSRISLKVAEEWLNEIKIANKDYKEYNQQSLEFILSHRWVKVFEQNDHFSDILKCVTSDIFKFNAHTLFLILKKLIKL